MHGAQHRGKVTEPACGWVLQTQLGALLTAFHFAVVRGDCLTWSFYTHVDHAVHVRAVNSHNHMPNNPQFVFRRSLLSVEMKVQGFQDYPVPLLSLHGYEKGSGQRTESRASWCSTSICSCQALSCRSFVCRGFGRRPTKFFQLFLLTTKKALLLQSPKWFLPFQTRGLSQWPVNQREFIIFLTSWGDFNVDSDL